MIPKLKPPYQGTKADAVKTEMQIMALLRKFGASGIQWTEYQGNRDLKFIIEVELKGVRKEIMVKVEPPLFLENRRTWNQKTGRHDIVKAPNYAQSMRLLYWYLKSKLEAVAYGLVSAEQEFLSQVLIKLPRGETTVGEMIAHRVFDDSIKQLASPEVTQ